MWSRGGDSGSPVFTINPDGNAMLFGIATSGGSSGSKRTTVMRYDRVLQSLFYSEGILINDN